MRLTIMSQTLIILLAVCAFTSAMVPRQRVARDLKTYCAGHTPCAWDVYKSGNQYVYEELKNTYCVCKEGLFCTREEYDEQVLAFVKRCRPQSENT